MLAMLALIGYAVHITQGTAFENAMRTARNAAEIEALRVKVRFEGGLDAARTMSNTFGAIKKASPEPSRKEVMEILKQVIQQQKDFFGSWCVWEPDAFDGNDAAFSGQPGHTGTGRFVPYWNKVGGLHMEGTGDTLDKPGQDGWYTGPRDSGKETVLEPSVYEINGEKTMVASLAVPIRAGGKVVGLVGVDLSAGFLQHITDSIESFGGKASMIMFSDSGAVAAATGHSEAAGKPLADLTTHAREMQDSVKRNKEYHVFADGALSVVVPLSFGKSPQVWGVAVSVPEDVIMADARSLAFRLTLIGGLCLVLALGVMFFLATVLARPIRETAGAVNSIADGNLDVRLTPKGRDEVAAMQDAVNVMAGRLKDNIGEIETQNKLAQEKTLQAEQAMQAAEEARQMAEQARSQGMLHAAQRLESIVGELSGASNEISSQAAEVQSGSEQQRDRITRTATAMEEMSATVLEVAKSASQAAEQAQQDRENAQEGSEVVHHTVTAITGVQEKAELLKENMNSLGEQAESIGNIMTVIDDIADQTNLLALNAAIEAARAGDAGRGFAVVADEVRKLAEKTMNATKEVGASIRTIQDGTHSNIKAMDTVVQDIEEVAGLSKSSGKVLEEIVAGAEVSAGRIQSIATAAEEQSATTEEINRSVDEINVIAGETASAIAETAQASDGLARQATELKQLIDELKAEAC